MESLGSRFVFITYFDRPGSKGAAADHIKDPARSARHNMLTKVKLADVLSEVGATNTRVALHIQVVPES